MTAEQNQKIETALKALAATATVAGAFVPGAGVAGLLLKHSPALILQAHDALMSLRVEGVTTEELQARLREIDTVPETDALIDRLLNPPPSPGA